MLRFTLIGFSIVFFSTSLKAQNKYQSNPPSWTVSQSFPAEKDKWQIDGFQWLLLDRQVNLDSEETYYHYAFKLETPEAVNKLSNIEVSYDPSYESLSFHKIQLHRGTEVISTLERQIPQEIRKESSRDRLLYDSTFSVIFNLEDVRPGDILEYSFTRKGTNPLFKGHYFAVEYFQNVSPVGLTLLRILAPTKKLPQYFLANDAPSPKITKRGANTEMRWTIKESEKHQFYQDEPSWFDSRQSVVISNYSSWGELAQKLLPWYTIASDEAKYLRNVALDLTAGEETMAEKITKLSRFVQDEVRYLGFENGINAFKPHSSVGVYENRYGDCKDKSLLLVGLLQGIGVSAAPMLVNTNLRGALKEEEVSPYLFNHCVVMAKYKDDSVFIDPTLSNIGNQYRNMTFPTYGKGLLITDSTDGLATIFQKNEGRIEITERFTVAETEGSDPSKLEVNSRFEGIEADNIRAYFLGNSVDVITENYKKYFSYTYPHIRSIGLLEIDDDREANIIKVKETYEIDSLWTLEEGTWKALFINSQLRNMLSYNDDKNRSAPLYLNYPQDFIYNRILILPSPWTVKENLKRIEGNGYNYTYNEKVFDNNRRLVIRQVYKTSSNEIAAEDYDRFVRDHDEMLENISYELSKPASASFGLLSSNKEITALEDEAGFENAFAIVVYILGLIFGAFLFHQIIKKQLEKVDPPVESWVKEQRIKIGGWLSVFVLLEILMLINIMGSLMGTGQNSTSISSLFSQNEALSGSVVLTFTYELFLVFILVYTLHCFRHLFKHRSSVIKLFKLQLLILAVANGFFTLVTQLVAREIDFHNWFIYLISLICVALWYFYLSNSERAAETFVVRRDGGLIFTKTELALQKQEEEKGS